MDSRITATVGNKGKAVPSHAGALEALHCVLFAPGSREACAYMARSSCEPITNPSRQRSAAEFSASASEDGLAARRPKTASEVKERRKRAAAKLPPPTNVAERRASARATLGDGRSSRRFQLRQELRGLGA